MKKVALLLFCVCSSLVYAQTVTDSNDISITDPQDSSVVKGPFFGLEPNDTPQLLAPGFITTSASEYNGTLSPDGKTFYYTTVFPEDNFITFTQMQEDNTWSEPKVASFSGSCPDYDPIFSPDGSRLYFSSRRPWSEKIHSQVWFLERSKNSWSEPQHVMLMGADDNEFYSSITQDGILYFNKWSTGNIYRAVRTESGYQVESLPDIINAGYRKGDPFISPQEDYLIFSGYRADSLGKGDLYISFKINDQWTTPKNLGEPINSSALDMCPYVTADGKLFVFTSNRPVVNYAKLNIYIMSASFINDLQKKIIESSN